MPFRGWDLPGVMGLAAATIVLKSQRMLPGRNVVVAGAGPSTTRCRAHPATASAPHRAGGSTYVRSVTFQRRTVKMGVTGSTSQLNDRN